MADVTYRKLLNHFVLLRKEYSQTTHNVSTEGNILSGP